jgi:hypothetical protein
MLLQPHSGGGKVGQRGVKTRYQCFLNFHWKELIHLKVTTSLSRHNHLSTEVWKRKLQLDLFNAGEISRAAKLLTSQGSPLGSEEVLDKVKSKHSVGNM